MRARTASSSNASRPAKVRARSPGRLGNHRRTGAHTMLRDGNASFSPVLERRHQEAVTGGDIEVYILTPAGTTSTVLGGIEPARFCRYLLALTREEGSGLPR